MEILSDATFKGSVRIENPSFIIGDILNIEGNLMTEFGVQISSGNVYARSISLRTGLIEPYGDKYSQQTFQNKSGTIALTSDIPDICSINSVKYVTKFLTAPSDCTLFAVDLGVTDFSFTSNDRIISTRVDRYFMDGDTGKDPNINGGSGCYWESTSMDVILSNAYDPGKVLIRKASGVVCDDTTKYLLKLAYL